MEENSGDYIRTVLSRGYGKDFIEYCPISLETTKKDNSNNYYY